MEQRTRILHHTRSKTPIILAPSNPRPRKPTQSSKSTNANGRGKAPLASLDTEVSNWSRRQSKPREHNGSRSSSTGRREPGSNRIVSRDFLKSDQISDRSGDDDDPASPRRNVPLRRHTMGSMTNPWKKSQETSEPTSASRMSCPPPEASSPHDRNQLPNQRKWNGARQDIPNGPVVKLPAKNPILGDETNTNSKHSQLSRSSSRVSDQIESPSNTVVSEKGFPNSDFNQRHVPKNPKCHPRQDLTLHLQEKTIPTSLSSQLANRDSISLSSPVTSPVYSYSVSSQRPPNVHPPSSLNVHPSSLPSPPAVTSPTSPPQRNCSSPQITSGYSWKTDPRRRPFQASGEFSLSPEHGSHHAISPQHAFNVTSSPTLGTESTHTSSSMYTYTSPYAEKSSIRHHIHSGSDSGHSKNPNSVHNLGQHQCSISNHQSSKGLVNSVSATTPDSPRYHDERKSFPYQKINSSRYDSSSETLRSPSSSSSYKSVESSNPSHHDQCSYKTFDIRPQSSTRSPPARRISSPSHYESSHIQSEFENYNLTFPRHDHKNKTNTHGSNSLPRENRPVSTYNQGYNPMYDHSLSQNSKTAAQSRHSEKISVDSHIPFSFSRKRNSMRLATEGYGEMSYISQSIDYSDLPGSKNAGRSSLPKDMESTSQNTGKQSLTGGLLHETHGQSEDSERLRVPYVQDDVDRSESQPHDTSPGPFVRGCRQRDSYRMATSSNPDLLNCTDQEEETFISCEDILASDERGLSRKTFTPISKNENSKSSMFQALTDAREQIGGKIASPNSTDMKPSNIEIFSRIKRNSLRLATASLSDLSVILDEIDIGEPPDSPTTPTSNYDVIEHPSPMFIRHGTKLSPLAERSLERSGSSVSSRNSSSFGSFYSCQSIGHTSAKNSPNHASCHSSPRVSKSKVSTPDSVHKLMTANAHDSGISQSSEDTNSYRTFANTSIGSSEEMEYSMNQLALGGSLNRKRPVFYWTRQSPYPRQNNHNTIPASWKPREFSPSKSSTHNSPRYPKNGSIRSYGSTSSVESSSSNRKPPKQLPRSSQILQRYGCGLDSKSPKLCTRGSTDSLAHKATQPIQQRPSRNGIPSGNRENFTLPLPSKYTYSSDIDFDRNTQPNAPVSPTFVESPTADTPRSPPSLGRPKRKLYAGFDSQPLPMDTFFSDSSSVCTDVSYSSHGTDLSGQPDSGNFDESFYSIDNRSINDGKEGAFEASLTPKDFMNLTEINKNSQLRNHRSNSLHSTSTAKEGDVEYSEDDEDPFEETMTPYKNHHAHHHAWPGTNYNQSVTSSLPMTFSI